MTETEPARMTAAEASALIQAKQLSCEELTRSCLARIQARDPVVKAWLSLDPDRVIRRARKLDKLPSKGPLHGIPWGAKDVIDTADYPITRKSAIYDGLKVGRDAAPVAVVRGSDPLSILGKTDTVAFASGRRRRCRPTRIIRRTRLADRRPARARRSGIFRCHARLERKRADRTSGLPHSRAFTG